MNIPKQSPPLERGNLVKYSFNLINTEKISGKRADFLIFGKDPNSPARFELLNNANYQLPAATIFNYFSRY